MIMLNQVVLVGRIANEIKVEENGDKKSTKLTIAVPRSFKNTNGEYETDFIDCVLWDMIGSNVVEYCKKGDIVGIKGRLQSRTIEKYHSKMNIIEVIAEKVTFLSSKKED